MTRGRKHMEKSNLPELFRKSALAGVALAAALAWAPPTEARVTRIVVDTKVSPAFGGASFGTAGQYETLAGRVFGELDPGDHHNTIINDIDLAPKNSRGKVEYMATRSEEHTSELQSPY